MRLGFLQMEPRFGAAADNVAAILQQLVRVRGATVVLPELCTTGYLFESRTEAMALAEPADGPSLREFAALSRRNNLTLCLGFAERAGRRVYNSAATVLPSGQIHVYRKAHLFDREKLVFDAAPAQFTVIAGAARYGVMVCFDWFFPETCRSLALAGADIVLHPANLVLPYCQTAMITRCLENRVFAVTCNRTGMERRAGMTLRFTGRSQIVDPRGRVLARAGSRRAALQIVNVDPGEARDKRVTARNDLFADRRPALYGRITSAHARA